MNSFALPDTLKNMMKPNYLLTFLFIFFILFSTSCSNDISGPNGQEPGRGIELPAELTQAEKQLVESGHSFSFDVFKSTVEHDTVADNIFISPLSLSVALGMTMNGAQGETQEQMRQTLAFHGMDIEEINEGYRFLIERLITADPSVQMQIANSVWNRQEFEVNADFLDKLETYFDAEAQELDFDDPSSVDTINNWVEDNTNGLIETIIDRIPPSMVMYLINAIYFKGDWTHTFDKEDTKSRPFYLENGSEINVDMMRQDGAFNTYFSDEVRMIDLPYGDSLYTMSLMMPADPDTKIETFIADQLSQENFNTWLDNIAYRQTVVNLPKFEIEYELTMNEVLKSLGMEVAFNPNEADFRGINPNGGLFISQVKHKTFVTVDEEGTEAAAVTSIGMELTSMPPSFNANRPFIFLIREQQSGTVVFMGKVSHPAG
ncbi:serpin family protein [Gracilimonas mengyeensis]|uniref:Serpin B n=1 Tax=Gracilimonas mengyeensis TaxID=1302730 RepID=A0A521BM50_9BACT|nr:serpin family protein [Gracilimonas mengyeensis]SMO48175.1 serpin B [Gracilimonas mengyeensis]